MDVLLAFESVAADFPRADLVFVGSGLLEAPLRAKAIQSGLGAQIHFAEYQHNIHNIPDWLAAATVWLLPTEREGFKRVVDQHLSCYAATDPGVRAVA